MFQFLKNFLYNPKKGIPVSIFSLLLFVYLLDSLFEKIFKFDFFLINFIVYLFLILIFFEIFFNLIYYYLNRSFYKSPPKVDFDKIPYKGHPYIPYVLKERSKGLPPTIADYPLNKGKYKFHSVSTNNLGFVNGENGDRDVNFNKNDSIKKINCIGSSTTQNYLVYDDKIYSYPLELERILKNKLDQKIEVNNFGQGGYNTADILVRFLLQILDTKPDIVILYQGYADVRSYLSENFKSDYSHSRLNLSEILSDVKKSTFVPRTYLKSINFFLDKWFPVNLRHSLVELIHKQNMNLSVNPEDGLKVYERNIQYIIDICKAKNIKIILSTYCHYLYDDIKKNKLSLKYDEIIKEENKIIKKLADLNQVGFVDNNSLIPKKNEFFVDSIHFSHAGMQLLASNFANKIIEIYGKKVI